MATLSREELLKTADIDPEFGVIWNKIKDVFPPLASGSVADARKMLDERKAEMLKHMPAASLQGMIEEDIHITGRDGWQIPIRIHKPSVPQKGSPLFFVLHGGGFCLGSLDSDTAICRLFATHLGAICVNVDYRLAPEHPFPCAPHDSYDALKWAAANAASLGANPNNGFVIVGTSAGGNLADVVAHLARDEQMSPALTGSLLLIPTVANIYNIREEYKPMYLSMEQNQDVPVLPRSTLDWFMEAYKPDFDSSLYASLNHPAGHKGMPPTYLVACGLDPLRDDAIVYHHALETLGIPTRLKIYPGLPHSFWSFFPMLESTKQYFEDTIAGAQWLLEEGAGKRSDAL